MKRLLVFSWMTLLLSVSLAGCGSDEEKKKSEVQVGFDSAGLRADCKPVASNDGCVESDSDFAAACRESGNQVVYCAGCVQLCSGQAQRAPDDPN